MTLEFYKAIWRETKGYCPDQTFSVIFRKRTESAPSNNTGEKPLTIEELTCELNEMKKNLDIMDQNVVKHNNAMMLIPVLVTPVFLTLLALLIIGGIIYRKNKKS